MEVAWLQFVLLFYYVIYVTCIYMLPYTLYHIIRYIILYRGRTQRDAACSMLSRLSGHGQSHMLYWQDSRSSIWVFAIQIHILFTAASAAASQWLLHSLDPGCMQGMLCSPACRHTQAMGPVTPPHSVAGLHSLRGLA